MRMADVDNAAWTKLTGDCNGQSTCSFEYTGKVINECDGSLADYVQIFYTCILGKNTLGKTERWSILQKVAFARWKRSWST